MDNKEREIRSASLKLFTALKSNRNSIVEMINSGGNYLYQIAEECRYNNWNKTMEAWELISKLRADNPYPDDIENGEIVIDEMRITGKGAVIKAFISKDGKWVSKDNESNWHGITWMSYNVFIDADESASKSNSLQEAIWKTITR